MEPLWARAMHLTLDGDGTLTMQLVRSLRRAILTGALRPGERLPASRTLASELGLARNTVLVAYDHLLGEGYAVARRGSGTFVTSEIGNREVSTRGEGEGRGARPRLSRAGQRIVRRAPPRRPPLEGLRWNFQFGLPSFDDFPHALWARLLARHARSMTARDFEYGSVKGERSLRVEIARHIERTRGVVCRPWQIVVTAGSQQALDLVARVLLDPGDSALIEEPHYPGARRTLLAAGARIDAVPVDQDGLDLSRLPRGTKARLAYVTPSHQFPTGVVLSLPRRLALLEWARRSRAVIVEDDYDSEYRYSGRPIEALASLDRDGRVLYVGTFSKIVSPALRLGYVVLPEPLVEPITSAKSLTDSGSPRLEQRVLAEFLAKGHFARHVRRTRLRNASRRRALLHAVDRHLRGDAVVGGADAGLHLILWLPRLSPGEVPELVERAASAGVGVHALDPFYLHRPRKAGLLLGYAGIAEEEIDGGIATLARVLRGFPKGRGVSRPERSRGSVGTGATPPAEIGPSGRSGGNRNRPPVLR